MTKTIESAVDAASSWADIDGVLLVAQGVADGRDCIEVHLACRRQDLKAPIPDTFCGFPVVVLDQLDEIRAQ